VLVRQQDNPCCPRRSLLLPLCYIYRVAHLQLHPVQAAIGSSGNSAPERESSYHRQADSGEHTSMNTQCCKPQHIRDRGHISMPCVELAPRTITFHNPPCAALITLMLYQSWTINHCATHTALRISSSSRAAPRTITFHNPPCAALITLMLYQSWTINHCATHTALPISSFESCRQSPASVSAIAERGSQDTREPVQVNLNQ
jgi:hypothetical protein